MPPSTQKRKALIKGLGAAIFPKTKLLLEVHIRVTALIFVRATQHEGAKVFVADSFNGLCLFGIGRIFRIVDDSALQMLSFET
jgi:hypothetical protein